MKGRKRGLGPFVRFMETKGFYLVLGLCVIAVGVTGYVLFGREDPAGNIVDPQDVLQQEELEVQDPSLTEEDPEQNEEPDPEELQPVEDETEAEQLQPPEKEQNTEEPVSKPVEVQVPAYTKPVTGKVIRSFSGDTLVKDVTMGDWRTHNGTDFACKAKEQAVAFAAGTVISVEEQGLYGLCLTIDHGNGMTSMLAGLDSCKVKSGDQVTCGQVIGICAGNLEAESAQESHVHLEVKKEGKYIDPMSLLS